MNTLKVAIPEEVYAALQAEAQKAGVSMDAVASIFLCNAVTHTASKTPPKKR